VTVSKEMAMTVYDNANISILERSAREIAQDMIDAAWEDVTDETVWFEDQFLVDTAGGIRIAHVTIYDEEKTIRFDEVHGNDVVPIDDVIERRALLSNICPSAGEVDQ